MSKETIAIVFGGRSSEHEISCLSAGGVLSAIDRSKYEVVLIGITKAGKWVLVPQTHQLTITAGKMPEVPSDAPAVVADVAGFSDVFCRNAHVVLIVYIPQTVNDHRVDQLCVAHAETIT